MELVQKRQAILDRTKQETENDEEDAVLQGKIVQIVLNNAQATIENDPKFLCSFVNILHEFSQFSFVESFIGHIYAV